MGPFKLANRFRFGTDAGPALMLFVKADRQEALVVLRISLAAEIAQAAKGR